MLVNKTGNLLNVLEERSCGNTDSGNWTTVIVRVYGAINFVEHVFCLNIQRVVCNQAANSALVAVKLIRKF